VTQLTERKDIKHKPKTMRMTNHNLRWGKDKHGPDQLKGNVGPKKGYYSKNLYRLGRGDRAHSEHAWKDNGKGT
jgi:hypothetical protein